MEDDRKKVGLEIVKINTLKEKELENIKINELWVIHPSEEVPSGTRLCGCRAVCQV
ncbi:hypothetical protein JI735_19535 [Paenibacillus sonchi]|uniref:Uncharacterized protein n=1 Tax=Paenibacillus sonchi TaxID=373687 RepID=A0A974P7N8_9BACL|nr:hypothetical protein [Paenibacillus sonchi]QQZ58924.1 hypothetical protein JI735_19535 [Paenibacillus sonchi]